MDDLQFLAQQVKAKRLALGLSQEQVAKAAKIRQPTYSKLESGADVKLSTLLAVGNVLSSQILFFPRVAHEYKLRAECQEDFNTLLAIADKSIWDVNISKNTAFPDIVAVFKSDLSLFELIYLISKIDDGHVMAETVSLREKYTGERL